MAMQSEFHNAGAIAHVLKLSVQVFIGYRLHSFVIWFNTYYDTHYKEMFRKRV